MPSYTCLDLFCGCGGLSEGLVESQIEVVAGIDIWETAIRSYTQNFTHEGLCRDLTQFSPSELENHLGSSLSLDLIVGGPPCQGFSMAGKRDKKDPRNSLFMEFYRYLKYFRPKMFLMENVMGILSMKTGDGHPVIQIIMDKLGEDYSCHINKLYASDFEVPQNRRRVIIVGIRKDYQLVPPPIEPIIKSKDQRLPVGPLLEPKETVDSKYYLSDRAIDGINRKKAKMKDKKYGFGAQYLKLDQPSYTIPARYWKDGYDALIKYNESQIRRLTILELKRIQTFPDNYYLSGSNKDQIIQIGNAIPCKLGYYLGHYLKKTLDQL